MLRRERIIKRFILGISVLTSYISYTGSLNMHDINIIAERFMCDLLNILYGAELTNANDIVRNNSGYDLISKSKIARNRIFATVNKVKYFPRR